MTDRAPQLTESADSRDSTASLASTRREHGMGLYKPGQGYWTRVGTAIGLILLLLSAVAWLVKQCELVNIPLTTWTVSVSGVQGDIASGTDVRVLTESLTPGTAPTAVATGHVSEVTSSVAGRKALTLDKITYAEGQNTLAVGKNLAIGTAEGAPVVKIESIVGNPAFPRIWLQGPAALTLFLVGLGLIYWFVGIRARSVDFLIATDAEMKKVNWSSRKTIVDSTWMVVGASVLIAGLIYIIDIIFQWFFALIGVLAR